MKSNIFNDKDSERIKNIYDKLSDNNEFEIMFNNYTSKNKLSMSSFNNALCYVIKHSNTNNYNLVKDISLDITYGYNRENFDSYRITINGLKQINNQMNMLHNRQNHIIFSILVSEYSSNKEGITFIHKHKDIKNTFDIDEFDIRVRLSTEDELKRSTVKEQISLPLDEKERVNILFRYKQRVSSIIVDNEDCKLQLDCTIVKSSNNINNVESSFPSYELEIDFLKRKKKISDKYIELMLEEIYNLKRALQQGDNLISNTHKENVMVLYNNLIYGKDVGDTKQLYYMNSSSIEIQHVVDSLPNKYSVTDKADGERATLVIFSNKVYIIMSNFMEMKDTGITLSSKLSKYNNTILDGEYIYVSKYNKYLFLGFDIIFYCGDDMRNISVLKDRLIKLYDVISNCFNTKFKYNEYDGIFDIDNISKFYTVEISNHVELLNEMLKTSKNANVIDCKNFLLPIGGSDVEIFAYSYLMWNLYKNDEKIDVPYLIDGLVYTPLDQKYTKIAREIKYNIYKWKPQDKNSIDFYIEFERNKETGQLLNVYDNSSKKILENNMYRICNLYVGKIIDKVEHPVLFQQENNGYIAYLNIIDGDVRDVEGNIIQDKTVCEFYYDTSIDVPVRHRWVPMRTRYDKTESVIKYKKKYGNNFEIANRIWRSITNPTTIDDIIKLSDVKTYDEHMKYLKSKIDTSIITTERKQNVYYQISTKFAEPYRNFHNWIKSNLIYTYCSYKNVLDNSDKMYKKQMFILDIGCGRGGDIMKFYHSRVKSYVGLDPDSYGIHFATDGAISRYNRFKTKMPNCPKMFFMTADAKALLNYEDQLKVQVQMNKKNEDLLVKFFGKTDNDRPDISFDVITCQFAVHYFFENDTTITNLCENINRYLDENGFMILTTVDGETINNLFNKYNGSISSTYITPEGDEKLFFEMKRKYDKTDDIFRTGLPLDIHISTISEEGVYITEYIVDKNYIEKILYDKCGMVLVETDLFLNVYNNHKSFFDESADNEETAQTKKFYMKVKKFYDMTDNVNVASMKLSQLYRYYVFQKVKQVNTDFSNTVKKQQKSTTKQNVKKEQKPIPKQQKSVPKQQKSSNKQSRIMEI